MMLRTKFLLQNEEAEGEVEEDKFYRDWLQKEKGVFDLGVDLESIIDRIQKDKQLSAMSTRAKERMVRKQIQELFNERVSAEAVFRMAAKVEFMSKQVAEMRRGGVWSGESSVLDQSVSSAN
jgi:shikimate kinase